MASAAVSTRKAKRSRTSTSEAEDVLALPSASSCNTCPILRSEVDALKSDLEHETNLRSIEQRRQSQAETRLRRQLTLATEEADEARSALEDLRATSEADVVKAREARRAALARLARAEELAERYRQQGAGEDAERGELAGDAHLLRERVESLEEERDGLRMQLEEEIEANRAKAEEAKAVEAAEEDTATDSKKSALSPAPPTVMSELNRIRIKLAEAERANRQLQRKLTAAQSVADSAVRHKEEARSAKSRLERAEAELTELRREREDMRAVEDRWAGFRKDIVTAFGGDAQDGGTSIDSSDDEAAAAAAAANSGKIDTPPEVSFIVRKAQKLQEEVQTTRKHLAKTRSDLELQRQMATAAEKRSEASAASESSLKKKLVEAESRADASDLELRKLSAQQDVWKREADSLRSLLETYEQSEVRPPTPHKGGKGGASAVAADEEGPTVQGLRTSLSSAQEQIHLLTEEGTALKAEASAAKTEAESAQTELARVKDKFGKLRDALFKERENAEKAEERACQAETMAGKGSFDSDSTRVLHLKQNPLMDAVRAKYEAEIDALRKALEEKREESASSGNLSGSAAKTPLPGRTPPSGGALSSEQSALDAQKLHRRLKESFREQIGKFREGVYLLTGFKIDMMADSTPLRFKVRSLYAEREGDHLMFAWPNVQKGEAVTMLDLLDTPQAQLLAQDQSFEYMTKFKSLPAFLASVQLGLFEKQTFAG